MGICMLTNDGESALNNAITHNTTLKPKSFKVSNNSNDYNKAATDLTGAWITKDLCCYISQNEHTISFVTFVYSYEMANIGEVVGIYLDDGTLFMVGKPSSRFYPRNNMRFDLQLQRSDVNLFDYIDTSSFNINLYQIRQEFLQYMEKNQDLIILYDKFYEGEKLGSSVNVDSTGMLKNGLGEGVTVYNTEFLEGSSPSDIVQELNSQLRSVDIDSNHYVSKYQTHEELTIDNVTQFEGMGFDELVSNLTNYLKSGNLRYNYLFWQNTDISNVYSSKLLHFVDNLDYSMRFIQENRNKNHIFSKYVNSRTEKFLSYRLIRPVSIHSGSYITCKLHILNSLFTDSNIFKVRWNIHGDVYDGHTVNVLCSDGVGTVLHCTVTVFLGTSNIFETSFKIYVVPDYQTSITHIEVTNFIDQDYMITDTSETYCRLQGNFTKDANLILVPDDADVDITKIDNTLFKINVRNVTSNTQIPITVFSNSEKIGEFHLTQYHSDLQPCIIKPSYEVTSGVIGNNFLVLQNSHGNSLFFNYRDQEIYQSVFTGPSYLCVAEEGFFNFILYGTQQIRVTQYSLFDQSIQTLSKYKLGVSNLKHSGKYFLGKTLDNSIISFVIKNGELSRFRKYSYKSTDFSLYAGEKYVVYSLDNYIIVYGPTLDIEHMFLAADPISNIAVFENQVCYTTLNQNSITVCIFDIFTLDSVSYKIDVNKKEEFNLKKLHISVENKIFVIYCDVIHELDNTGKILRIPISQTGINRISLIQDEDYSIRYISSYTLRNRSYIITSRNSILSIESNFFDTNFRDPLTNITIRKVDFISELQQVDIQRIMSGNLQYTELSPVCEIDTHSYTTNIFKDIDSIKISRI